MKSANIFCRKFSYLIFLLFLSNSFAQVGINTTTPAGGSILDVRSTNKGMLVPRVDIDNLSTIAPVTGGSTESLLVYNTNTTTGKGFHYWDGTEWVNLEGAPDEEKWDLLGNANTDEDINFVGTTDNEALTFRTDNVERFRIANGNQVLAMANGSAAAPFYSWNDDQTMGFWRSGTRQMDMVINGSTFFNANANTGGGSDLEWSFNPGGADMNLRVETDNQANALFVSGEHDNVGLGTNAPSPSAQLELADINRGLLMNRVSLSATNVAAPITSPAEGLLVYNTNSTTNGPNEVTPGVYMWDGAKWLAVFNKFDYARFEQDPLTITQNPGNSNTFRTVDGVQNVPGLVSRQFTPKYTGIYELKLSTNYGSGQIEDPITGQVSVGTQEGTFHFTCDNGVGNIDVYAHSYSSVDRRGSSPDDKRFAIWRESTTTRYLSLVAGTTYTFSLAFEQYASDRFDASASGQGRGYIGLDIPCEVVWTFKKDN